MAKVLKVKEGQKIMFEHDGTQHQCSIHVRAITKGKAGGRVELVLEDDSRRFNFGIAGGCNGAR